MISAHRSHVWQSVFRTMLGAAPQALSRRLGQRWSAFPYVELVVKGRKSGVTCPVIVTLFEMDGRWYVGHPNGRSQWVRNLLTAESAIIVRQRASVVVRPVELDHGVERDRVVARTGRQPFPANLVYRAGRSHVAAVGTYVRLERVEQQQTSKSRASELLPSNLE
jgi:hypothetical protein